jgi:hypothetical protein
MFEEMTSALLVLSEKTPLGISCKGCYLVFTVNFILAGVNLLRKY